MKTTKTKKQIATWFADYLSDCGNNDYYGFKLTDSEFIYQFTSENTKAQMINTLCNHSFDTQLYLDTIDINAEMIFPNIQDAKKSGLLFHVVNENEVHSFNKKSSAVEDLLRGKKECKKMGIEFPVQLIF